CNWSRDEVLSNNIRQFPWIEEHAARKPKPGMFVIKSTFPGFGQTFYLLCFGFINSLNPTRSEKSAGFQLTFFWKEFPDTPNHL
ncbi:MAG TPA: hypothetical protein PLB18_20480, partial [Acidobacteriota bacterium]|nr:hypothetical protein [Acidobacteriota bacterium]